MIPMYRVRKKASVIFYLLDDFTGKAVITATITVSGQTIPFVNKQDGYYVFMNLEASEYEFIIEANPYQKVIKHLIFNDAEPIVMQVNLQHEANSRLIDGSTRIKGNVTNEAGNPVANENLQIVVMSPSLSIRLVDEVSSGDGRIKMYSKQRHDLIGKQFFIADEDNQEAVTIAKYYADGEWFALEKSIKYNHATATQLYPLWTVKTNECGIFVLPLAIRSSGVAKIDIQIMQAKKVYKDEITLVDGQVTEVDITL